MLKGKVYKLSAPNCDKIYIGSTYSKYASVRLAHHRQYHRNKWKDYQGLFDNGDPQMEILAEIELKVHGAVPIGVEVQGAARCIELKDHTLTFDCEIHDGPRLVAAAIMRRTMVERVSFLARTAALSIISQQSQTN